MLWMITGIFFFENIITAVYVHGKMCDKLKWNKDKNKTKKKKKEKSNINPT